MRKHGLNLVFILFVLTACNYNAPLVGEASLPIDQALLGTWELIPEDVAGQRSHVRIVVGQESANMYAIEYFPGESDYTDVDTVVYFKGWPAEFGGITFVQLEVTGTNEGPVSAEDTDLFSVFSCTLANGELTVRSLNTNMVNEDLADTAALRAAFTANRDDPDLFEEPGQFRKLPDGPDDFPNK